MRRRLPARVLPLVRTIGPYGWIAAGLVAGAWLAREYPRRARGTRSAGDDRALARWESEGGAFSD